MLQTPILSLPSLPIWPATLTMEAGTGETSAATEAESTEVEAPEGTANTIEVAGTHTANHLQVMTDATGV